MITRKIRTGISSKQWVANLLQIPLFVWLCDPDWLWGINSSLRFRDFTFGISLDGRVGGIAQTTLRCTCGEPVPIPIRSAGKIPRCQQSRTRNYTGEGVKVVSGEATYDTYGNITSDNRTYAPNDVAVTIRHT